MSIEIERKFLVDQSKLPMLGEGDSILQGYILTQSKTAVRLRIKCKAAYLTIKGENIGNTRLEFEYEIPVNDAKLMLNELCDGPKIEKTRYEIPFRNHVWELDIFHGDNTGLVLAEIELQEEGERFEKPGWLTKEVSDDARYYNANLAINPYSHWSE